MSDPTESTDLPNFLDWSQRYLKTVSEPKGLLHDEFLRLECLDQAVRAIGMVGDAGSTDTILGRAERFRQFVQDGHSLPIDAETAKRLRTELENLGLSKSSKEETTS